MELSIVEGECKCRKRRMTMRMQKRRKKRRSTGGESRWWVDDMEGNARVKRNISRDALIMKNSLKSYINIEIYGCEEC